MNKTAVRPEPSKTLALIDVVAIIVGIVVGVGIFKFPSLVAQNVSSAEMLLLAWVAGGLLSIVGALCYAELATTYPHAGGDYHYLHRAYGETISFLFAWARMLVIQPGAIVMVAFIIGEELTRYMPLGPYSHSLYATLVIVLLTAVNMVGIRQGRWTQKLLTAGILLGLLVLIGIGFASPGAAPAAAGSAGGQTMAGFGMAMIFILLTYGGWNESAYVSAEIQHPERNIIRSLLIGLGVVMVIYLLVNLAYYRVLGLAQMAQFDAPQRLVAMTLGSRFVPFVSAIMILAALSTANATIITGARSNYALGHNFRIFSFLGQWREKTGTPLRALVFQGVVSLLLVGMGTLTKGGLTTMVDYTSPAFWFFFLLTGFSLFVFRTWDGQRPRAFRVPLYPLTPLLFVIACIYMLQSSLAYTGRGAIVSVIVLITALPVILFNRWLSSGR
jgi:basic amino acid/polyamine antiporter, APA family